MEQDKVWAIANTEMDLITKETGSMVFDMAKESTHSQMGLAMMVNGKMIQCMEKES